MNKIPLVRAGFIYNGTGFRYGDLRLYICLNWSKGSRIRQHELSIPKRKQGLSFNSPCIIIIIQDLLLKAQNIFETGYFKNAHYQFRWIADQDSAFVAHCLLSFQHYAQPG